MLVRIVSRLLLAGSGSWLLLTACPQLRADSFRDGLGTDTPADPDGGGSPNAGSGGSAPIIGETPDNDPDASLPTLVDTLRAALAHRYALDGTGTAATDSVGDADGFVWNTTLDGRGFLSLAGDDEYLSLPNGLLSSGNDKTIEIWITWHGGPAWQRIFDFGSSDAGELNQGSGLTYLFLTAASSQDLMTVAYSQNGFANELRLNGTEALPTDALTHVAVVIDSARDALSLYLNGAPNATTKLTQRLVDVRDVNTWIGRSQFSTDPSLDADVSEFRIYDRALDAEQVALSYQLGPDSPLMNTP